MWPRTMATASPRTDTGSRLGELAVRGGYASVSLFLAVNPNCRRNKGLYLFHR